MSVERLARGESRHLIYSRLGVSLEVKSRVDTSSVYLLTVFTLIAALCACEEVERRVSPEQSTPHTLIDMGGHTSRADASAQRDNGQAQARDMIVTSRDRDVDQSVEQPQRDASSPTDGGQDTQTGDALPPDAMIEVVEPFEPRPVEIEVSAPQNVARQLPTRDGQSVVADNGLVRLTVAEGANSPLAGFARCAFWIQSCMRSGQASLDDCALSAPICQTQPSWQQTELCCPSECFDAYATSRMSGVSRVNAFKSVYFDQMSCFPELRMELSR